MYKNPTKYYYRLARVFYIIISIVASNNAFSQGEANNWYFGYGAGIDFNSGKPEALTNSDFYSAEGGATISTKDGRLLFYTEGVNVWDSTHQVMPNGYGLLGDNSTTQSSIIIPKPNSNKIFYLFAVDDQAGKNGLTYSEIDMDSNAGFGDIVTGKKNIQLTTPVCEKLTSVRYSNGVDIWVLVHKFKTDTIYAYLVTKSGVSSKPIKSTSGVIISKYDIAGQMKISPNGKKIAASHYSNSIIIGDFNPSSGKISNVISLPVAAYGLEFSPAGKYLYTTFSNELVQYDMTSNSQKAILESEKTIVSYKDNGYYNFWSLQLAPDGKIYIASPDTLIHVIHAPDSGGMKCRFQGNFIDLKDEICGLGLPNFISSYFNWINFEVKGTCLNDTISFIIQDFKNSDSLRWDFGDPSSGIKNYSSKKVNVSHIYKKKGTYKVSLTNYSGNQTTLGYSYIEIKSPEPFIGKDTFLCAGSRMQIGSKKEYKSYYWSNDSITKTITIDRAGSYILKALDNSGCSGSDTILVKIISNKPDLGGKKVICMKNPIIISPKKNYLSYKWSIDSTTKSIIITDTGIYSLTALDSFGCKWTDTVVVNRAVTRANFESSDICESDSASFLNQSHDAEIYRWKFGDGENSVKEHPKHFYKVNGVSHTYNVTLVSMLTGGCADSISKAVSINANPNSDFTFTTNQNGVDFKSIQSGNTSYKWFLGNGDSALTEYITFKYPKSGKYTVCLNVTNAAGCFSQTCKEISVSVGISQIHQSYYFKVYPNPNNGMFTIEIENPAKDVSIEVYDLIGNLIKMVDTLPNQVAYKVDLTLAQGIYLFRVKKGDMIYYQKIEVNN
jgi:PKD repeat protein